MGNRRKNPTKMQWLWEYSKKAIRVILNTWVIWNYYIMITMIITGDYTNVAIIYPELTDFTKVVVGGYLIKSMMENVFKISKNPKEDETNNLNKPMG